MTRFLLSGYYGYGNLGDEALLDVIVAQLRARWPGAAIDVLSADPAGTTARLGVEATPRFERTAVLRAIDRADVVLSGGGGLLQNVTSLRSLLYYAGIIRAAVAGGKTTMIFGQSIGPLDVFGRAVVRVLCAGVAAATVRDERSRALLARLIPHLRVERTADPVFLFEPPAEPLDLVAEGLGGDEPLVVVSVRRWQHGESTTLALAAAVDRFAELGARVAFLPLGGIADAEASTAVIRRAKSTPVLLPDFPLAQAAQVIARASFVVGMRLHALIIAAKLGVPFLSVPYDPKVVSLADDLRYPLEPLYVPAKGRPDEAAIVRRVDDAWARRAELAAHLRTMGPEIVALADRNFAVLDELLTERTRSAGR